MSAASDDRAAHGFERSIRAQWSDMDQNGHMRTTAYLAAAEDVSYAVLRRGPAMFRSTAHPPLIRLRQIPTAGIALVPIFIPTGSGQRGASARPAVAVTQS